MPKVDNYNTPITPTWCPGCGDYAIWMSIKQTLVNMNIDPHEIALVFDIGCSSNMADKINGYAFKSLHGRVLATAAGVYMANPNLNIIAIGGDGGIMEEGVSHLLWAARSNYNITTILHNNQTFGLTTGQPTTTTEKGQPGKTATSKGVIESRVNPSQLALTAQASFVARGFAGDPAQLKSLMEEAIKHKGFAFLEVLQPCVTYNDHNTFEWFRERVYKVEGEKHDINNWDDAFDIAKSWKDKIATGILYQDKNSAPYLEQLPQRQGKGETLVGEVRKYSIKEHINEFE